MFKRKLQAVINRLEDDKSAVKRTIINNLKKLDELDAEYVEDQYGTEVVDAEVYEVALGIERSKGFGAGINYALERLNMLKESVKQ